MKTFRGLLEITTKEGERESTIITDPETNLTIEIYDVDDIVNLKYKGKLIGEFGFDEFKELISTVNSKLSKIQYKR